MMNRQERRELRALRRDRAELQALLESIWHHERDSLSTARQDMLAAAIRIIGGSGPRPYMPELHDQ